MFSTVETLPGDICVFIRPELYSGPSGLVCVMINSLVRHAHGQTADRLVWVKPHDTETDNLTGLIQASPRKCHEINALESWLERLPKSIENLQSEEKWDAK